MNRFVCGILVALGIAYAPPRVASEGEVQDAGQRAAELTVTLEDSVLVEGQSAYMILRLRNRDAKALDDVAEMRPSGHAMRLMLKRTDTGELQPYTGHIRETQVVEEGSHLPPSEMRCEVWDLAIYFGQRDPKGTGLAERLGYKSLRPGSYELSWEYDLHTGSRPGIPKVRMAGAGIRFRVVPVETAVKERALVAGFLAGLPITKPGGDRSALHSYAREWLPQFYASPYLIRVYLSTGLLLNDLDFDAIYKGARRAGASSGRLAALLGVRMSMTDTRGKFTEAWRASMRRNVPSQLERDVLMIAPAHQ